MRIFAILCLALSLIASGWLVGNGLSLNKQALKLVTVKGLAEKEVKADLALWPLRFVRTGNNLANTQQEIDADEKQVMAFLTKYGLDVDSISLKSTEVTDREALIYNEGKHESRFVVMRTMMIRSTNVDKVAQAYQANSDLISAGVILNRENQGGEPVYLFNGLNQLKPTMIAAATKNARASAQQFAQDSNSVIGDIQSADQGVFEILPRDKASFFQQEHQIDKTLRVVVTLKYRLQASKS